MNDDSGSERLLSFEIQRQPDDTTCGATCLHALYRHFGDELPFADVVAEVPTLTDGGTLGVLLATHALERGYEAKIYTWNLSLFDPTWFELPAAEMRAKLLARAAAREDKKLRVAANAYAEFIRLGGKVALRELSPTLLRSYLKRRLPLLVGLSATFLYRSERERSHDDEPDDVHGDPVGHFTVLTGYTSKSREVYVTDPLYPNPLSSVHTYPVAIDRVVGAIYLGVLTYDANLIVLQPKG